MKRAKVSAEDLFAERIVIQVEAGHIRRDRLVTRAHLLKPGAVVAAQRFAHRKADQAGAISLIDIPLLAQLVKLMLGYAGEPAAKTFAVLKRAQLSYVRNAVVVGIDQRGFEL